MCYVYIEKVKHGFYCMLFVESQFNFLKAFLKSPGVGALYLWSNGSLRSYIYVLESVRCTNFADRLISRKCGFTCPTAFLQCFGMRHGNLHAYWLLCVCEHFLNFFSLFALIKNKQKMKIRLCKLITFYSRNYYLS